MPDLPLPPDLAAALGQMDDLVQAFDQHPDPAVQDRVLALLRCVDRIHRGGLRRLAELLRLSGLEQPARADPEVRLLFELYELNEGGERARAEAVLEELRSAVESHGGRLEVAAASAGVVTVRLSGAALRQAVEQALRGALPDFVRLEVEEPPPPPTAFVPSESLKLRRRPQPPA